MEPPFDTVEEIQKNPNYDYYDWFKRGKQLPKITEIIVGILKEQNFEDPSEVTDRIIYASGWVGDKNCIAVLTPAIYSSHVYLASDAIAALGRLGAIGLFDTFVLLLLDKKQEINIRANALIAIATLRHTKSQELIDKMKKDSNLFLVKCAEEGQRILDSP
ncbi:hypothetical protein C6989_05935 [Nitrosopumilus sp. b2]|nr:hypothetical protein C6989_05935 [Nitrosopumilus sp. b2]